MATSILPEPVTTRPPVAEGERGGKGKLSQCNAMPNAACEIFAIHDAIKNINLEIISGNPVAVVCKPG